MLSLLQFHFVSIFSNSILELIGNQPGGVGRLVMSNRAVPVRTTLSAADAVQYAAFVASVVTKARTAATDLNGGQDIQVLRVTSFKNEFVIIPHITSLW
jgi:predicted regulator of Ras-like GTPase activity (Roadblock/LC7/MglB family)